MSLKNDIIKAAARKGINPYKHPFKPADLGLSASDYGSFSDYCSKEETVSGKWNKQVILKVAEFGKTGRPRRYLLL